MADQTKLIYAWERRVVAPRLLSQVPYEDAQAFVNGIWLALGLLYPPQVAPMPKQNRKRWADATRLAIRLPEGSTPAWVLLHEIAHALTNTVHGQGDGHGSDFMGVYMKLLDQFGNLPLALQMFSLQAEEIVFNLAAQPTFKGGKDGIV